MFKVSREEHGYNILSGFIVSLQVATIILGLNIIRIRLSEGDTVFSEIIVFMFLAVVWLIGEILIAKFYLKD